MSARAMHCLSLTGLLLAAPLAPALAQNAPASSTFCGLFPLGCPGPTPAPPPPLLGPPDDADAAAPPPPTHVAAKHRHRAPKHAAKPSAQQG